MAHAPASPRPRCTACWRSSTRPGRCSTPRTRVRAGGLHEDGRLLAVPDSRPGRGARIQASAPSRRSCWPAGITGAHGRLRTRVLDVVIAYPLNIGGRPFHSWVSFIPPAFETTILFAAFTAAFGMLALNGLPQPYHPVFNAPRFALATPGQVLPRHRGGRPEVRRGGHARRSCRVCSSREVVELDLSRSKARPRAEVGTSARSSCLELRLRSALHLPCALCSRRCAAAARTCTTRRGTTRSRPARSCPRAARRSRSSPGTVARASSHEDELLHTGKIAGAAADAFPFAITRADLDRGEQRFNIYCSPCHGRTGEGNGMVVQRGYQQAASYHIDRLRQAPAGYFFDVDDQRIRRDAGLSRADSARGPVADHRVRAGAAVEPLRSGELALTCGSGQGEGGRRGHAGQGAGRPRRTGLGDGQTGVRRGSDEGQTSTLDRPAWRQMTTLNEAALMARPTAEIGRMGTRAIVAGAVGLALGVVGFLTDESARHVFLQSYLIAFVFWLGITLGSLGVLMIQHLSGGAWGLVARRVLEASTRNLPLMALLFVPIAFQLPTLYSWARPEAAADHIIHRKAAYLNAAVLLHPRGRVLRDLGSARLLAEQMVEGAGQKPAVPPGPLDRRFRMLSGPGLVLFVITITFMSVDWVMSLDPALVLDHLRHPHDWRVRLVDDGVHDRGPGVAGAVQADVRGRRGRSLSRPEQADVCLRAALGLLQRLAAHHHLVGQPAGGDSVLPRAAARPVAARQHRRAAWTFRRAVRAAPLTVPEAHAQPRGLGRAVHPRHARRRNGVDDRTDGPPRRRIGPALARLCRDARRSAASGCSCSSATWPAARSCRRTIRT